MKIVDLDCSLYDPRDIYENISNDFQVIQVESNEIEYTPNQLFDKYSCLAICLMNKLVGKILLIAASASGRVFLEEGFHFFIHFPFTPSVTNIYRSWGLWIWTVDHMTQEISIRIASIICKSIKAKGKELHYTPAQLLDEYGYHLYWYL